MEMVAQTVNPLNGHTLQAAKTTGTIEASVPTGSLRLTNASGLLDGGLCE